VPRRPAAAPSPGDPPRRHAPATGGPTGGSRYRGAVTTPPGPVPPDGIPSGPGNALDAVTTGRIRSGPDTAHGDVAEDDRAERDVPPPPPVELAGPGPTDGSTDHDVVADVGVGDEGDAEQAAEQGGELAAEGDDALGEVGDPAARDPLRFNRWMRSSASGGILTGIALGLQHALEERREQPAFVMEAPGEPEDPDAPISLHFDPDDPTKTVAVIRGPSHGGRRGGSPAPSGD